MNPLEFMGAAVGLYKIVPPDEAHVRITPNKKDVFSVRDKNPNYWYIPFITKVTKLPLSNIRIDVPSIKLNDKNMAKFMCDIVCFVNIKEPALAAERTGLTVETARFATDDGILPVSNDFKAIVESIARTMATKQDILQFYSDREVVRKAVAAECAIVFPEWGLSLVNLEITHIKDADGSFIIQNIEKKNAAEKEADARVKIAQENQRAAIIEAETTRETEMKRAEMEEQWKKRQIEKDRTIAISEQEKNKQTAEKAKEANTTLVEAERAKSVGLASVVKEKTIQEAEAKKQELSIIAEGEALRIERTGNAEAQIIKAKKVADAEGTQKLAEAQQKFNDAATTIEFIKANKDVGLAYAGAYKDMIGKSNISLIAGSPQELFGGTLTNVKVGPKEGAALQQMIDANPDLAKSLIEKLVNPKKESKE